MTIARMLDHQSRSYNDFLLAIDRQHEAAGLPVYATDPAPYRRVPVTHHKKPKKIEGENGYGGLWIINNPPKYTDTTELLAHLR